MRFLTPLSDTQIKRKLEFSQSSPRKGRPPLSHLNSLGGSTPALATHQAPGCRVDRGEGEVGALDLPHDAGLQPVVGGHGTICLDVGARGGQRQGL